QLAVDRENFGRAIFNIIENAMEAMEDPPRRLTISTASAAGFLELRFQDSGKGIDRDKIKSIYDPFFTSKTYGPGLGLTFALKAVQNHNGLIAVESAAGQGTTFTIRLPIRPSR
ncbi:MAG: ATP-binding protein, partial [Pseudomonadota bacterium]